MFWKAGWLPKVISWLLLPFWESLMKGGLSFQFFLMFSKLFRPAVIWLRAAPWGVLRGESDSWGEFGRLTVVLKSGDPLSSYLEYKSYLALNLILSSRCCSRLSLSCRVSFSSIKSIFLIWLWIGCLDELLLLRGYVIELLSPLLSPPWEGTWAISILYPRLN